MLFKAVNGFDGDIIIPEGITSILPYTFFGCSYSGILKIPNSVTEISETAFMNNKFSRIIVDNSITNIPGIYKNTNILYDNIEYLK